MRDAGFEPATSCLSQEDTIVSRDIPALAFSLRSLLGI
jgi:hypothetical protein